MKRNTKVKGFTLIELIIVMAVFGLLLFGVMQLIDPVSKVMKQSAIQENNAASVNNMKEYLEKVTARTGLVFSTTYSGKGLYGMMKEIEKHDLKDKNILFWHTGGLMNIMK